jgi:SRSO17 transposase
VPSKAPATSITVVDQYCDAYRDLFAEVRTFENFKHLHVGMISEMKRKSLPASLLEEELHSDITVIGSCTSERIQTSSKSSSLAIVLCIP